MAPRTIPASRTRPETPSPEWIGWFSPWADEPLVVTLPGPGAPYRRTVTTRRASEIARAYAYRGRHRKPQPVVHTLQVTAALAILTVLSVLLGNPQPGTRQRALDAAARVAPTTNNLSPTTTRTGASGATGAPRHSRGEWAGSKSDSGTATASQKHGKRWKSGSEASTSSSPTSEQVTQAAAQPTDQIGTWLNQALGVLKANGYPESKMDASGIRLIIEHESAGNPNAINLSDSNAANGTPSKGLMQVIGPTFNNYALPGYGDIYNPVDNIIAGVRYAIATYGSIDNVPGVVSVNDGGSYQGY